MRELDEMMKKKERVFRGQEHGRSWIKRNKRIIYVCIILIREWNKKSFFLDECYRTHLQIDVHCSKSAKKFCFTSTAARYFWYISGAKIVLQFFSSTAVNALTGQIIGNQRKGFCDSSLCVCTSTFNMVLSSYGNKYRKNVLLGIQTYTARLKSNFSELDSFFKWEMLTRVFRILVKNLIKKNFIRKKLMF